MSATLLLQQPATIPDTELPRRIASGDRRAFEQLMRRHNRSLYRTARAILRDDAEAEDAVQEAYLRAYRCLGSFRGDAKLSTWLMRIVANEALGRRRKDGRRTQIVPMFGADVQEHEVEAEIGMRDQDQQDGLAERIELRRLLEAKIDALPDAFRAVFVLRALEELSVDETAEVLGLAPGTVRSRFLRARSQLREALSKEVDLAIADAFAFAGERCDRIVARVLARLAADDFR